MRIAVVNVVVEGRGEQVVGRGDSVDVPGKVQVDVLHRRDLSIAATRAPALQAEARPERRFPQTDGGALAQAVERVAQADGGGGFALAGWSRVDGRDENQLAGRRVFELLAEILRDLGLDAAIVFEVFGADPELGGHVVNGAE